MDDVRELIRKGRSNFHKVRADRLLAEAIERLQHHVKLAAQLCQEQPGFMEGGATSAVEALNTLAKEAQQQVQEGRNVIEALATRAQEAYQGNTGHAEGRWSADGKSWIGARGSGGSMPPADAAVQPASQHDSDEVKAGDIKEDEHDAPTQEESTLWIAVGGNGASYRTNRTFKSRSKTGERIQKLTVVMATRVGDWLKCENGNWLPIYSKKKGRELMVSCDIFTTFRIEFANACRIAGFRSNGARAANQQVFEESGLSLRITYEWEPELGPNCGWVKVVQNGVAGALTEQQWHRFLRNTMRSIGPCDIATFCDRLLAEIVSEAMNGFQEDEGHGDALDEDAPSGVWLNRARADFRTRYSDIYNIPLMEQRRITIYVWGDSLRSPANRCPRVNGLCSQKNFNSKMLTGRGGGIDTRRFNGTDRRIQRRILRCGAWADWLDGVIRSVETNNYTTISINCSKGRHRSVGGAILLKELVYHNATIVFMERRNGWGTDQTRNYTDTDVNY